MPYKAMWRKSYKIINALKFPLPCLSQHSYDTFPWEAFADEISRKAIFETKLEQDGSAWKQFLFLIHLNE